MAMTMAMERLPLPGPRLQCLAAPEDPIPEGVTPGPRRAHITKSAPWGRRLLDRPCLFPIPSIAMAPGASWSMTRLSPAQVLPRDDRWGHYRWPHTNYLCPAIACQIGHYLPRIEALGPGVRLPTSASIMPVLGFNGGRRRTVATGTGWPGCAEGKSPLSTAWSYVPRVGGLRVAGASSGWAWEGGE